MKIFDFSNVLRKRRLITCITKNILFKFQAGAEQSTKDYNLTILKQVQAIFGHLAYSKLQLYVPRGLWKHFRMHGEPVNLREQQDADEFFIRLKEAVEDALKVSLLLPIIDGAAVLFRYFDIYSLLIYTDKTIFSFKSFFEFS